MQGRQEAGEKIYIYISCTHNVNVYSGTPHKAKATPDMRTPLCKDNFAESQMHSFSTNQPPPPEISIKDKIMVATIEGFHYSLTVKLLNKGHIVTSNFCQLYNYREVVFL